MSVVTVNGKKVSYPSRTPLSKVAADFQAEYPAKIVLALKNNVLRELFRTVGEGGDVAFLTVADAAGKSTYERSAVFLLVKAFYDTDPKAFHALYADFSLSNGLFLRLRNGKVTKALLSRVEKRMRELVKADLPFTKEVISTRKAISEFTERGMSEKAKIFMYRRASESNLYHLGDFSDYFYAYLVPSTGYLTEFKLIPYETGFILQTPEQTSPNRILPYRPKEKLFRTMLESTEWCEALGLNCVGDLNDRIVAGKSTDLILLQEAVMEKKIGDIAAEIRKSGKRIVMIAGPSSSGKTTFSLRLSVQLMALGITPHAIACDDYFRNRADYPVDENGNVDFESIECVDRKQLSADLAALLRGETINLPTYNFTTGQREYRGKTLSLGTDDVVVIEGIHCLNEALTESLPKSDKYKIYISALTQLNIDEHTHIPTTDGRLLRRIVRDARTRGYSARDTISRWDSVKAGEEKNIFPYQEDCDVMVNSALIYELAVLKPYAEPLLYSVPRDSAEYLEAKRLLKFMDYFLAIPSEEIPKNSLVREFIGGGIFDV